MQLPPAAPLVRLRSHSHRKDVAALQGLERRPGGSARGVALRGQEPDGVTVNLRPWLAANRQWLLLPAKKCCTLLRGNGKVGIMQHVRQRHTF